jgi:predicted TIM-barrel fold metal-dependent hydrolase
MGDNAPPEFLKRVAEDYFKRADSMFKSFTPDELVAQMDAAGVEKSIITVGSNQANEKQLAFAKQHPDRFALAVAVDPRRGMKAIRELEGLVKNEPVVLARVTPFMVGGLAPTDYRYFPLYTKCIEWKLPVSINTGSPDRRCRARARIRCTSTRSAISCPSSSS